MRIDVRKIKHNSGNKWESFTNTFEQIESYKRTV
jgi:hypothetical protein